MGLFKIDDVVTPVAQLGEFMLPSLKISEFVVCKSPEKLLQVINRLAPGEGIEYVTEGDWSLIDMVVALVATYRPAELWMATYAIREHPIRQLILAQDRGDISEINLLLETRARIHTPVVYQLAAANANRIAVTPVHAKATVIRSPVGSITISGSQNYTRNPKLENGVISLCDRRAAFNISWIKTKLENGEIIE